MSIEERLNYQVRMSDLKPLGGLMDYFGRNKPTTQTIPRGTGLIIYNASIPVLSLVTIYGIYSGLELLAR